MNSLSNSRKRRWLLLCVVILGIGWGIDGLVTTLKFGLPESLGALSLFGLLAPYLWFHRGAWPFRLAITLCMVEVFLSVVSFFESVISFMDLDVTNCDIKLEVAICDFKFGLRMVAEALSATTKYDSGVNVARHSNVEWCLR